MIHTRRRETNSNNAHFQLVRIPIRHFISVCVRQSYYITHTIVSGSQPTRVNEFPNSTYANAPITIFSHYFSTINVPTIKLRRKENLRWSIQFKT